MTDIIFLVIVKTPPHTSFYLYVLLLFVVAALVQKPNHLLGFLKLISLQ